MYLVYIRVSGALILLFGLVCAAYLALWAAGAVVWSPDITMCLICIACVWTLCAGVSRLFMGHPLLNIKAVWPRAILLALVLIGLGLFSAAQICILSGMASPAPTAYRVIITPGAMVWGDQPSSMLAHRLRGALDLYNQKTDAMLITTGGQGSNEDYAEADVAALYLEARGVPGSSILREDMSTNTRDNLIFSKNIMEEHGMGHAPIAISTNDYHAYRCGKYAEALVFEGVEVMALGTLPLQRPVCHIREGMSVIRDWFFGFH